jgi:hypothetical protein
MNKEHRWRRKEKNCPKYHHRTTCMLQTRGGTEVHQSLRKNKWVSLTNRRKCLVVEQVKQLMLEEEENFHCCCCCCCCCCCLLNFHTMLNKKILILSIDRICKLFRRQKRSDSDSFPELLGRKEKEPFPCRDSLQRFCEIRCLQKSTIHKTEYYYYYYC